MSQPSQISSMFCPSGWTCMDYTNYSSIIVIVYCLQCEHVLFVYVFTLIPPRLSDPCNFITVLLVTREPEQTTLLFWSAACGVTPHGLHTAASARHFQICFLPEYFDRLFVYLLFVHLVLFMHQAMCNIFWHLRNVYLDAGSSLISSRCLSRSILFIAIVCMARFV